MAIGRMARARARAAGAEGTATSGEGAAGDDPRVTRRAALAMGGALAGAAAASATPAMAGHEPRQPTPNRPPPSSDLFSYEETVLAFRNHGFHLETLDRPITPLGSHYLLIHFDIPQLSDAGYSITVGGRVRNPMRVTLEQLKARPNVTEAAILECAGVGRSYSHPRAIYVPWFNEPIGVYEYTGTPLGPILEQAGLEDDAACRGRECRVRLNAGSTGCSKVERPRVRADGPLVLIAAASSLFAARSLLADARSLKAPALSGHRAPLEHHRRFRPLVERGAPLGRDDRGNWDAQPFDAADEIAP
jgi:Oxidoreductase molybdopterin binding domain